MAWFHFMFQLEFCSSLPLLDIYWECTWLSENFFGKAFLLRINVAISTVVLFFPSVTSFYCGLYPAVSCFQIPSSLQNSSNCSECACLSLWIILILLPLCSSTNALNLWTLERFPISSSDNVHRSFLNNHPWRSEYTRAGWEKEFSFFHMCQYEWALMVPLLSISSV